MQELMQHAVSPVVDGAGQEALEAHAQLANAVDQQGPQASVFVRKQPKRYKNFLKTRQKRSSIKEVLELAKQNSEESLTNTTVNVVIAKEADQVEEVNDNKKTNKYASKA